jgi:ferredoxin-NADP reductase
MTDPVPTTILAVRDLLPDMRLLDLARPDGWVWRPGQYLQLHVPGHPPRFYSIATTPDESVLRLHVRNTGSGGVSQAVVGLRPGDTVAISGPAGRMDLARAAGRSIVMLAGGTGIAPFCAMLSAMDAGTEVTLFWGVKHADGFYCHDDLAAMVRRLPRLSVRLIAESRDSMTLAEAIVRADMDFSFTHLYIAGPRSMVEATLPALLRCGADPAHIDGDDPLIETLQAQETTS